MEQGQCALHIGCDEGRRPHNGPVDVRFRREVHHRIGPRDRAWAAVSRYGLRPLPAKHRPHAVQVTNVTMHEVVAAIPPTIVAGRYVRETLQVPRVREEVEVHDLHVGVLR